MTKSLIDIGIVGAGPAGIAAAISAAKAGAQVTLYDTNDRIGRKLLVTGNGRCNLSNSAAQPGAYSGTEIHRLQPLFESHGPDWLVDWLRSQGILTHATEDGWWYPLSNSAASVVGLLELSLSDLKVRFRPRTKITSIRQTQSGIVLLTPDAQTKLQHDRVILCPGGKAYPALGSRGTLLPALAALGHSLKPVLPALAPIQVKYGRVAALQGVRLDTSISLWHQERLLADETGNMIFSKHGLNGPAAMNLSHLVAANKQHDLHVTIDLLPRDGSSYLVDYVNRNSSSSAPLSTLLLAVLPPRVPPVLLELENLAPDARTKDLSSRQIRRVLRRMHNLTLPVTDTGSFTQAQLSSGGVPLSEIDPETYASLCAPNLYLAGEVLDVIGPCGGFNLQFSFASGALAGESAARRT